MTVAQAGMGYGQGRPGDVDDNRWTGDASWVQAKQIIGTERVTLGPSASQQWLDAPDHLAMVLARYRVAAALIGNSPSVAELGCGEGIGAGILAKGRRQYTGFDADHDALAEAKEHHPSLVFRNLDLTTRPPHSGCHTAVVSLDVIEHIPVEHEARFMGWVVGSLYGGSEAANCLAVIGTPNAAFDHLASPQSKAGHINLYTHDRLLALMRRSFHVVQSFGLQDTSLHLGHPEARHYLMFCGIGPRRE